MVLKDNMPRRPATDPLPPAMTIWERYRWDAKDAFVRQELEKPVKCIHFTHTATAECGTPQECAMVVRELQQAHMAKGMPDIQYNWLVGGGGLVFEGRGWDVEPSVFQDDVKEFDGSVLSIAYIGTFTGIKDLDPEFFRRLIFSKEIQKLRIRKKDKYPPKEMMHTSGLLLGEAMEKNVYSQEVVFMPLKLQPKRPVAGKEKKKEKEEQAIGVEDENKVKQPKSNSRQKTAFEAGTPDYRMFLNDPIGEK